MLKQAKDKTYTFRHWRCLWGKKKFGKIKAQNSLIEEELSKGYFPMNIRTELKKVNAMGEYKIPYFSNETLNPIQEIWLADCCSAYMGKKMARKFWAKNKFMKTPTLKEYIEGLIKKYPLSFIMNYYGVMEKLIELEAIENYFIVMLGIGLEIRVKSILRPEGRFYGKSLADKIKKLK